MSKENLRRDGKESLLTNGQLQLVVGDGRQVYSHKFFSNCSIQLLIYISN